jgi:hypothetical protein
MNYDGDAFRVTEQIDPLTNEVEGWEITGRGRDGLYRWCDFFLMLADLEQFVRWARERSLRVEGRFELF